MTILCSGKAPYDDHRHNPRYEIVGEAGTGRQGLQMARELKPDLVLLDMALPDIRGLVLIGDILKFSSQTCILVVSMHSKINYIVKSFQSGAMGYLAKESAADKLLDSRSPIRSRTSFAGMTIPNL